MSEGQGKEAASGIALERSNHTSVCRGVKKGKTQESFSFYHSFWSWNL